VVIENGSSKNGTYTLFLGFLEGLLSLKKEGPTKGGILFMEEEREK